MSNPISRRNFFRLGGVAVLAVAAAGLLAGCKPTRPVHVLYYAGSTVLFEEDIKVPANAEALTAEMLHIPEGYALSADANLKIGADGNAGVRVEKLREITVRFETGATVTHAFSTEVKMQVAESVTSIDVSTLTAPEGYTISSTGSVPINGGVAVVAVTPKAAA